MCTLLKCRENIFFWPMRDEMTSAFKYVDQFMLPCLFIFNARLLAYYNMQIHGFVFVR